MSLNILSLNCYIFPPIISFFGSKLGNESTRIKRIAKAFLKMHSSPDIIACQELWSDRKRRKLFSLIKHQYPYKFEDPHYSFFTLGSGLAIFSKHPIQKAKIYRFKHWRGHYEFFAKKGFIIAKIIKENKPVYIINTHLQAGASKDRFLSPYHKMSTDEVKAAQLNEISRAFKEFIAQDAPSTSIEDHMVILTGDLNMFPNEMAYSSIENAFPKAQNLAVEKQEITGSVFDENGFVKDNRLVDHIISIGKPVEGHSKVIQDIDYSMSDHLAVQGEIQLKI